MFKFFKRLFLKPPKTQAIPIGNCLMGINNE